MPSFLLKKYEPKEDHKTQESMDATQDPQTEHSKEQQEQAEEIEVMASDSVAKIVAQALYKAMPNVEIIRKEEAEREHKSQQTGAAVSVEEINSDPVQALKSVGASKFVVVLAENGFHTAKEEWFLQTLENKGVKTFYTAASFVKHVQRTLK